MASMVGNPTGSVGEPGGVRAAAIAKAVNPTARAANLGGIKGEYNPQREQRSRNALNRSEREAQRGRARNPGHGGLKPQNRVELA